MGRVGAILDGISPLLRWWWAPVILGLLATLWVRGNQLETARKAVKQAEFNLATNTLRVQAMADRALALAVQLAATAEATNRRINDDADHQAHAATIVYRDRVMRIPAAAYSSGACKAGVPQAKPAPGADSTGGDTILITRADALICADNTARIEKAHDWAKEMIEKGLMVPAAKE